MHELGITRNIVAIVGEHAAGGRVLRVKVEIGRLSGVLSDAVRFCFDVCADGTALQGAVLEIVDVDGRGACAACGTESPLTQPVGRCPRCGAAALRIVAGDQLMIKEMEVQPCA